MAQLFSNRVSDAFVFLSKQEETKEEFEGGLSYHFILICAAIDINIYLEFRLQAYTAIDSSS